MIKVVCGIVVNDGGEILICRRKKGKSLAGFWEFPGGKLEVEENEKECLKRELLEELGLKVTDIKFLHSNVHDYSLFKINLLSYLCKFKEGKFLLNDHDEIRWVRDVELLDYDLAPADIEVAALIKRGGITSLQNINTDPCNNEHS